MSRKSLILCLATLFAMFVALGVAIAFLYSGIGSASRAREVSLKGARSCLAAVPSDAALVVCSSRADKLCNGLLSVFDLPDSLAAGMEGGELASLKRSPMSASLHYSGSLVSLYVFDLQDVSELASVALADKLERLGYHMGRDGRFLAVSSSETLVKSSLRHLDRKISIVNAPGFAEAADAAEGESMIFIPHLHFKKLLPAVGDKIVTRYSSFLERIADWSAFAVAQEGRSHLVLSGALVHDGDPDEFINVIGKGTPRVSRIGDILPSYTVSAVSLPVSDEYMSAYESFVDTRQTLHELLARQKALGTPAGVMPEEFFSQLKPREIATASFKVDGKMERINLICPGDMDVSLVFKGCGLSSLRGYVPSVHQWAWPSFMASVYGPLFSLKDEACFTYADGWIITGSRKAIDEYVSRNALGYTLNRYLADAGRGDMLTQPQVLALCYLSLTEGKDGLMSALKPAAKRMLSGVMDAEYSPVLLTVGRNKDDFTVSVDMLGLTLKKTKAPQYERDTTVAVPAGPFKVKNSHTGKMNTFYQNSSKAICLSDENGKDLWGVPFGKSLCGTAHTVDYYANGKLQIIFGAGSCIYLIDRLGRYVNGFPLELGKDIMLGPDVYDFSGARKYNIMVLHKDNTIEMYNLKGRKPEAWKGITAPETIKALPERISLAGKDFWVVRTSIQTLIFPFYGGAPLTVFDSDSRIRPDSVIKVVDASSVEVNCYDGKVRTVKLK